MTLIIESQPIPLRTDADGVVRVGGTRVTLDTVVEAFQEGLTAEEFVQQYPSLSLADVYSVIGYSLHHRAKIDRYLAERNRLRDEVRRQNEHRQDSLDIRKRLISRDVNR